VMQLVVDVSWSVYGYGAICMTWLRIEMVEEQKRSDCSKAGRGKYEVNEIFSTTINDGYMQLAESLGKDGPKLGIESDELATGAFGMPIGHIGEISLALAKWMEVMKYKKVGLNNSSQRSNTAIEWIN
nr:HB1/Asxl, restriction endonuclease HTH domain-containing protein [Tanacetum cinerariifolium]